jgi:hypothetical protein
MANVSSRSAGPVLVACFGVANWVLLTLDGCGARTAIDLANASATASGAAGTANDGEGRAGAHSGKGIGGTAQSNTGGGGSGGSFSGRGGGTHGTSSGGDMGSGGTRGAGSGGIGAGGGTIGTGGFPWISTEPNLKVAFIGDTSTGTDYQDVLTLVKNEQAAALVVQGDMSYSDDPEDWWTVTELVLGTSFPIFISRGNHDDASWSGYLAKAQNHLGGATRVAGAHDANYKTIWKGLVIATIRMGDSAAQLAPLLQNENHIWKVCHWHQNQEPMQVGDKSDEMGWDVYEACRRHGAIIETGHEHSYSRTRTLINIEAQAVDSSCLGASLLCVGPGRTFVSVVGLGGHSVRAQTRCLPTTPPYGCNGEWGFIYTSDQGATFGAQFITFNAGNPRRASGYFKDVHGRIVDTFSIRYRP